MLSLAGLLIFREKPGVLSYEAVWVCLDSEGFMYTARTLVRLLWIVLSEWQDERHMVG